MNAVRRAEEARGCRVVDVSAAEVRLGPDLVPAGRGRQAARGAPHRSQGPRQRRGHGHRHPQRDALRLNQGDKFRARHRARRRGRSPSMARTTCRNPVRRRTGLGRVLINCELTSSEVARSKRDSRSMSYPIKSPRKLIEVALPLDAINVAAVRERNPSDTGIPARFICGGHGDHWRQRGLSSSPSWSTIPATSRAVGSSTGRTRRKRPSSESGCSRSSKISCSGRTPPTRQCWKRARAEIRRSWREVCELNKDHPQAAELFNPDKLPALHDPFAGGGAIPLEAQRLGSGEPTQRSEPGSRAHQQGDGSRSRRSSRHVPPVGPCRRRKIGGNGSRCRQTWPGTSGTRRRMCAATARGFALRHDSAHRLIYTAEGHCRNGPLTEGLTGWKPL